MRWGSNNINADVCEKVIVNTIVNMDESVNND